MDSNAYCSVWEDQLLDFAAENHGKHFVFQEHDAAVHRSMYTLSLLTARYIEGMQWSSDFLNFNHIKNIWSLLARRVNKEGDQNIYVSTFIMLSG